MSMREYNMLLQDESMANGADLVSPQDLKEGVEHMDNTQLDEYYSE